MMMKRTSTAPPATIAFDSPRRNGSLVSSNAAKNGRYVFGSRRRKSKIPVRPGSMPVENVDHDTGVCAGTVGRSGRNVPSARSRARFGSFPSFIHFSVYLASTPSNPRTITFCWACAAIGISRAHARSKRWTMTCMIQVRGQGAGGGAQVVVVARTPPAPRALRPAPSRSFLRMRRTAFTILVLLLAACGGGEKNKSNAGDTNHLVIAAMSSPTNLDSRVGNDNVSGRMFDLIYSGLVRITPNMDYAPDVAEKWETPDDKTIVFHLNPKAKFHNGQAVKAADVKWTYEPLNAPNFISSKKSGYASVDHIETPDDHTVIFKLKEPNAGIFDNLTLGIPPTGADTNVYKTKPIGCGPYKVVDFRADDRVELEAFDDWHLGAPHIKKVTVRIIPDATTRVLELERGTVNLDR